MKKIININLSGRVIPIEDSAYEKLQSYIESLRRYFAKETDRDEIINDIESRVAELMNEKIRKGAACITDADIDQIAASMGRPEDFDAQETEKESTYANTHQQQQQTFTEERKRRRLYRDTGDKFIGGVCSGIAAYLNVDPAIVRILFAIITFGGFGLGFVAYILLWIILPARDIEGFSGKRLYRNPEDRMIGGVAGGLAAYFNRETWVIRLIFAAPFLFSIFLGMIRAFSFHYDFDFFPNIFFGSLGSTFVLAYIILWMVLPEARSTYEKMEMRGEKVDVNTIRQNMKDRVKEWGSEVKESAQNLSNKAKEFGNTRGREFATEVKETVRRRGSGIGHAIGVLFRVFFLFIAGTIAFGIFVALMALLFGGIAWWPINNYLWTSQSQQLYAWGTLIFFLLVPLIGFIIWLIRRIVGVRSKHSYMGWIFGSLWAIGWVLAVLFVTSAARDLSEYEAGGEKVISVTQPSNGKMTVLVSQPELEYTGRFNWMNDGGTGWDLTPDSMMISLVNLDVERSPDSLYHVSVRAFSYGRTRGDAIRRAEAINYSVQSLDSVLDIANGFAVYKEQKFRGQGVEVSVQVPVGKKIRFDETVRQKLNSGDFRAKRRIRRDRVQIEFDNSIKFWWRSNTDYTMHADGKLRDASGSTIDSRNYRYESNWEDPTELQRQLQEEKRIREETEKRIKELEEKNKNKPAPPSVETESMDSKDDVAGAGTAFPSFSLVKMFF